MNYIQRLLCCIKPQNEKQQINALDQGNVKVNSN